MGPTGHQPIRVPVGEGPERWASRSSHRTVLLVVQSRAVSGASPAQALRVVSRTGWPPGPPAAGPAVAVVVGPAAGSAGRAPSATRRSAAALRANALLAHRVSRAGTWSLTRAIRSRPATFRSSFSAWRSLSGGTGTGSASRAKGLPETTTSRKTSGVDGTRPRTWATEDAWSITTSTRRPAVSRR